MSWQLHPYGHEEGGGGTVTVKLADDVAVPPGAITLMRPLVAPGGTGDDIRVPLVTVNVAGVPLNVTDDAPLKLVPSIATVVPTPPDVGLNPVIDGGGGGGAPLTMKLEDDVPVPAYVVTAIGPLVAPLGTPAVMTLSLETVYPALVPLNVTRAAPMNPDARTVTAVPTGPDIGLKLEMVGLLGGGGVGVPPASC
jgi:hypothetical protein